MQLQSFLAMLFIFVVLPVFLLFSNHTIFYIVMSSVLLIDSLISIYSSVTRKNQYRVSISEEDEEFINNLKIDTGFDLKWFSTCIMIARYLIAILFYIYCSYYVKNIFLNILISIVIIYWIHRIVRSIKENNNSKVNIPFWLERALTFTANTSSAFIIAIVTFIKIR